MRQPERDVPTSHLSCNPDLISGDPSYFNRFTGATGDWLLARQTNCLLKVISRLINAPEVSLKISFNQGTAEVKNPEQSKESVTEDTKLSSAVNFPNYFSNLSVLDVGGNHGQVAIPLALLGAKVTVVQSRGIGNGSQIHNFIRSFSNILPELGNRIVVKEAQDLTAIKDLPELKNSSFDIVTCFRILPHIKDPSSFTRSLAEQSRIAAVVEYPNKKSINVLSSLMFKLKRKIEKDTRPFVLFSNSEFNAIRDEDYINQYTLPLALHRYLSNPSISAALESLTAQLGITKRFGSPTIAAVRR